MMTASNLRPPTAFERSLMDLMLENDFPGRDTLAKQLSDVLVETVDTDGSLRLHSEGSIRTITVDRVPVEAEAEADDGVTVHALLHVVGGVPSELEFYREDSQQAVPLPPLDRWRVMTQPFL